MISLQPTQAEIDARDLKNLIENRMFRARVKKRQPYTAEELFEAWTIYPTINYTIEEIQQAMERMNG